MRPEVQIREQLHNQKFLNFFELTGSQFEDFKRQVALNGGVLEMYIHPFQYLNQVVDSASSSKYDKQKTIEKAISLRLSTKDKKPSLVLEQDGYHQELERHIQNLETPIIYIVTEPNSAKPKFKNKLTRDSIFSITSKLNEAGVKEIQLAGGVLIKKWKNAKPVMEGCVGEAAQIFGSNFKISFLENLTIIEERPKPQFRYGSE